MRIAILGSNSFLAQYVIRDLETQGHHLFLYGVTPSAEFPGMDFLLFKYPEHPLEFSQLLKFDLVIYLASAGIHPGLNESRELIYELNAFFPIRLLEFLSIKGFKGKLITFGSYFEIGNEPEMKFYSETDLVLSSHPVPNHYAASKRLLSRYLFSSPDLPPWYHLVLPTIYGRGENPNRLIPYIINSIRNGSEMKLTAGTQVRQYIHNSDVSQAIRSIGHNDFPSGIYNLCNAEPVRIRELVRTIFRVMGKGGNYDTIPFGQGVRADTSMPFLLLDNSKTKTIMNFMPVISLESGIQTYL